jgi:hypothetical protein
MRKDHQKEQTDGKLENNTENNIENNTVSSS